MNSKIINTSHTHFKKKRERNSSLPLVWATRIRSRRFMRSTSVDAGILQLGEFQFRWHFQVRFLRISLHVSLDRSWVASVMLNISAAFVLFDGIFYILVWFKLLMENDSWRLVAVVHVGVMTSLPLGAHGRARMRGKLMVNSWLGQIGASLSVRAARSNRR